MFAVIKYQGKQYIVSKGDRIIVPHVDAEVGATVHITDVLLVSDDTKTSIGTPFVKAASVDVKIVAQQKGDKITVRRYKSKVRYRKTRGFRPMETEIEIIAVS